jgi:ATP-dependent RNA helicase DeaD
MASFYEIGLSQPIIKATSKMGFEEMTPIQEQTIPLGMAGDDVIGQAQTGTGKTAAFGIPLIEKINMESESIQGLVIAPTRELAIQVAEELNRISRFAGIKALPIYGGQDIRHQIRALKNKPKIIVGTPGRLMDHMRRKTIRLQQITTVVLDEADEMLNMGFIEDIETILREVPKERQTLLFSATMPKQIRNLAKQFMKNPKFISIRGKEVTVPDTEQSYIEVPENQKFDILCRILDIHSPKLAIIFGRTKRRVDELSEALSIRGYSAEGIHGDLTQSKRDNVLHRFKEGNTEILVATDVAARGLDIEGVTHVYNFDIPQDPESYVHRVGRTGRAGKSGIAMTFVTPREIGHLKLIEQLIKRKIVRTPAPTLIEAIEEQKHLAMEKLLQTINEGNIHPYKKLAETLLEETDSVSLLSAALKLLTKEPDTTPVRLTAESPIRTKKPRNKTNRKPGSHPGSHRKREGNFHKGKKNYKK